MRYIVLLTCLIGYVWSETCTSSHSECRHTTCDASSELHCVDGLCTCTTAHNMSCASLQDCLSVTDWDCPGRRRHCIDTICRCARF